MATPTVQRILYSAPREEFIHALKRDGCVIVQNFTDLQTLEQARLEVDPWLNKNDNSQVGGEKDKYDAFMRFLEKEKILIQVTALNGGTKTCTRLIGRSKTVREKFFSDPLYQVGF